MPNYLIQFFATREDILPIAGWVESRRAITYVKAGLFVDKALMKYTTASELPNLGKSMSENAINGDSYLVVDSDHSINVRKVDQVSGGTCYSIDQLKNPDSVAFQAGGFWNKETLLYGRVGTARDSVASLELYKLFGSAIRKCFARIGAFYVGPDAKQHAEQGCRLAIGVQSPKNYDLRFE